MDREPAPSKRKVATWLLTGMAVITLSVIAGPAVWSTDGEPSISEPIQASLQGWTFGDTDADVLGIMRHKDVIRALGSQRFEITPDLEQEGVYEGLVPGRTAEGCYRGAWFVEYREHTVERTSRLLPFWVRDVVEKHMDFVFFKLEGPNQDFCG